MKPKWVREAEANIANWKARRERLIQELSNLLPAGHPLKQVNVVSNDRRIV